MLFSYSIPQFMVKYRFGHFVDRAERTKSHVLKANQGDFTSLQIVNMKQKQEKIDSQCPFLRANPSTATEMGSTTPHHSLSDTGNQCAINSSMIHHPSVTSTSMQPTYVMLLAISLILTIFLALLQLKVN
jgi:hypothetical protein